MSKITYGEAKRAYERWGSYAAAGRALGVSDSTVQYTLNLDARVQHCAAGRAHKDRRRSQGLCLSCGGPAEDLAHCAKCREARRERDAARWTSLRAAGICYCCGVEPAAEGRTRCKECASRQHVHRSARRKTSIEIGACSECGRPRGPKGTKTYCRPCADKHNAREKARYHEQKQKRSD